MKNVGGGGGLFVIALFLASCCTTQAPPACAPCPKVVKKPTAVPKPAPRLTPKPAPPKAQPVRRLSSNCQAKLALTEEVSRLLIKAAAHATRSGACMDGPGTRVAVDEILVCPKRVRDGKAVVEANYRVGRFNEGDTRMCGRGPNACGWLKPTFSEHLASFTFTGKGKVLRLTIPVKLPGLPGMTALDKTHRGGCYGDSGPFVPVTIKLP